MHSRYILPIGCIYDAIVPLIYSWLTRAAQQGQATYL